MGGLHTGQFVYCGSKAQLAVGNVLPLAKMPEGTVISMVEEKATDRGRFARAGGCSCMIVGHSDDGKKSRIRLPRCDRHCGGRWPHGQAHLESRQPVPQVP